MTFNPDKTRNWDRLTLNDGDLFNNEFDRIYENLNELNTRYTDLLEKHTRLEKSERIVGEKFWLDDYREPSDSFPAFCISSPDGILSAANWPDLTTHLYNKSLRYDPPGLNTDQFKIINWSVDNSSVTATLTLIDDNATNTILTALDADWQINSSFTDWRTLTIPVSLSDAINSGTYLIMDYDLAERKLSFSYSGPTASADVSNDPLAVLKFHPHRIWGSNNTVRHFSLEGRNFFTVSQSEDYWVGGLRRPDQLQSHLHKTYNTYLQKSGGQVVTDGPYNLKGRWFDSDAPINARVGDKTHGPGLGLFAYIWGATFIP